MTTITESCTCVRFTQSSGVRGRSSSVPNPQVRKCRQAHSLFSSLENHRILVNFYSVCCVFICNFCWESWSNLYRSTGCPDMGLSWSFDSHSTRMPGYCLLYITLYCNYYVFISLCRPYRFWRPLNLCNGYRGPFPPKSNSRGYNWAILFLGEINTETWPSWLGESQK
jgi:hypothetical protein